MGATNKNQLSEVEKLHAEKQRLQAICTLKEAKLRGHYDELRNNYVRMAIYSLLPFERNTKGKVMQGIDFATKFVLPNVLGISFGKGKTGWKQNLIKLSQAAAIAIAFTVLKKILSQKAKKSTEEVDSV